MKSVLNAEIRLGAATQPVRIPVGVAPTVTESKEIGFTRVHNCGSPVKTKGGGQKKAAKPVVAVKTTLFCPACGVAVDNPTNGFEYMPGAYLTFTDEEVSAAKGERSSIVTVGKFVPRPTIPALMVATTHYLIPNEYVQDGYATLFQALAKTKMAGFAHHSLWGKERPCVIYAETSFETGGVLLMQSLHLWEDVVSPDFSAPIPAKTAEKIMKEIIVAGTGSLDETDLVSTQRGRVETMVKAKLEGVPVPAVDEGVESEQVEDTNLMDALTRTLEAMKTPA